MYIVDVNLEDFETGSFSDSNDFLHVSRTQFLADRTNGRAYATLATVLRPSVVCRLSVTLCIVAIRCVLEQKLLLAAYRKSYGNRLVPK